MQQQGSTVNATAPATMRAARIHAAGLVAEEVATPAAAAGEALVRVHAAALTRDELDWPADRLPATPSYEVSGVVAAIGPDVEGVAVGDEVYGLTPFDRDGVASEYAAVPATALAAKPRTLDHVESAAVPLAALSAWQGLLDHGRMQEDERVLIVGAAGGVGHFATQIARRRRAHVVASVSPASFAHARALGAEEILDHTAANWTESVEPFDLVLDTAGGDRLARAAGLVRDGGRLVSVAHEPPRRDGIEAVFFIVKPRREQLHSLAALIDAGEIRPAVDSVFALDDVRAAYDRVMSHETRGKVVLRVTP